MGVQKSQNWHLHNGVMKSVRFHTLLCLLFEAWNNCYVSLKRYVAFYIMFLEVIRSITLLLLISLSKQHQHNKHKVALPVYVPELFYHPSSLFPFCN